MASSPFLRRGPSDQLVVAIPTTLALDWHLSLSARGIAMTLMAAFTDERGRCVPDLEAVAARNAGCTAGRVARAIRELCREGYLTVTDADPTAYVWAVDLLAAR